MYIYIAARTYIYIYISLLKQYIYIYIAARIYMYIYI